FGSLYGVKIPENLADEMPDEKDLPYLEMLYKFVCGKQSYYDLASTRHVEPQSKDNDNEAEELRRQRGG
ncbi:replication protein, partial [Acinetobacter baumannii]